jgi:GNAT superfamily N-acetyltransferase
VDFEFLTDCPSALPTIAKWYFEQWGHTVPGDSLEGAITRMQGYLNLGQLPLIVTAIDDGEVIGAAQLKFREMSIYPEREHWLGGVYIRSSHRRFGVASRLVSRSLEIARSFNVDSLFLQTERLDGGLYARLGWEPREQVTYKGVRVLVMERSLSE